MTDTRSPLPGLAVEALFRGTVVAFSRHYWKLRLREGHRLPDGPCFLYGNHSNNYDAFMINAFTSWGNTTAGVMTMEYMDKHPLALLFRRVGILGTRKRVPEPHLIRRIYALLNAGRSFIVYPEGGRRWDGRPLKWIESTVKLFVRAGVPVYPIITHGSYVAWPRWARYPRPARIELEVLEPFLFDRSTPIESALEQLRARIDIDENIVARHIAPGRAFQPAVGIERLLYRDPVTGESGGILTGDGVRISNLDGSLKWRMLPDSRILDESTGDILLTGDLYDTIRSIPSDQGPSKPMLSARTTVEGSIGRLGEIRERSARLELFRSHLLIDGKDRYHVPIEDILYSSTERNDKLVLALTDGSLTMHYRYSGSPLQWHDELLRSAPEINP